MSRRRGVWVAIPLKYFRRLHQKSSENKAAKKIKNHSELHSFLTSLSEIGILEKEVFVYQLIAQEKKRQNIHFLQLPHVPLSSLSLYAWLQP